VDFLGHVEFETTVIELQCVERACAEGFLDVEGENGFVEGVITPVQVVAGRAAVVDHVELDVGGEILEELELGLDPKAAVIVIGIVEIATVYVLTFEVGGLVLEATADVE
jgi:hypothetical protein